MLKHVTAAGVQMGCGPLVCAQHNPTFSSFAFMVELIVVGVTNWKEGAALLGYCTGNITSILTLWLPKCTDTVQLRFTASICERKSSNF